MDVSLLGSYWVPIGFLLGSYGLLWVPYVDPLGSYGFLLGAYGFLWVTMGSYCVPVRVPIGFL